jgi:arylsulfatase A-like enzyme/multidrug efflux pump subunit AcrA (membrane-fusion protein)
MDTLRADRLSCLGHPGRLTPNLDRIAAEGALFTQAYATDIPTQPSHTAVFTGRYGVNTSIVSHFHPAAQLDEDMPWLPTMFRDLGCATGAVDHLFAMKDWFVRGYEDYMPPPGRSRSPASVINGIAFPWLTKHAEDDFFLFLHYWDAHIPYVPPSPFKERFTAGTAGRRDPLVQQKLRSRPSYPLFKQNLYDHLSEIPNLEYIAELYEAEVAYLDFEIGNLFDHLRRLGILDDTLVVLFGDHGENMTEHDAWFDHAGLYDSVVHVPLIIRAPGRVPEGQLDQMVALVDVMPTVLELQELTAVPGTDGRSLVPLLTGQATTHRDVVMLSEATWAARRGVRTPEWKYIRCYDPGVYLRDGDELYHLTEDPDEQVNVAAEHPEVVAALSGMLDAWLAEQLGDRPDPMEDVMAVGLPAVNRLDSLMAGGPVPPVASVGTSDTGSVAPGATLLLDPDPTLGSPAVTVADATPAAPSAGMVASTAVLPAVAEAPTAHIPAVPAAPPVYKPEARHAPSRHGGRRAIFLLVAGLCALGLLAFVIDAVFLGHPVEATGVVQPLQTASLNLPETGPITEVDVTTGQEVHKGDVLAKESTDAAAAKLAADQSKLASDQAALAALQGGTTSTPAPAASVSQQTQVANDQAQLQAAQSKVADVTAAQNAAVAQAESQVTQAQNLLNADRQTQAQLVGQCTTANPPASCAAAAHQVQADQAALANAQSAYQAAEAQQKSAIADAENGVAVAQAALSAAEGVPTSVTVTTPADPQQLANAQDAIASDQAAITADRQNLAGAVLVAPFDGVVAQVNGAPGDVQTQAGVAQNATPQGVTTPGSSGISIFPQQQAPSTKNPSQFAPLIQLNSLNDRIVAQVPENDISKVRLGQWAEVTLPAVPNSQFRAKVAQIDPTAVTVGAEQYYLVELSLPARAGQRLGELPFAAAATGHGHHVAAVSAEGKLVAGRPETAVADRWRPTPGDPVVTGAARPLYLVSRRLHCAPHRGRPGGR